MSFTKNGTGLPHFCLTVTVIYLTKLYIHHKSGVHVQLYGMKNPSISKGKIQIIQHLCSLKLGDFFLFRTGSVMEAETPASNHYEAATGACSSGGENLY